MAECAHMECPDDVCIVRLVRCSFCHREVRRRTDGTLRTHGPHGNRCPGSIKPSAQRSAEGAHINEEQT